MDDPDPSKNLVWADVAGFTDSSGDLIEFINQFINKKLFLIAKEVKIIVPFTEGKMWYWGINEDSSLWYPSIKILRSENFEDWKNPIKNLIDLLSQEIIHERDN